MNKKLLIGLLVLLVVAGFTYYGNPIFKPFGNSTAFKDSTNYMTINKSVYVLDSFKVAKDFYAGVKGGKIYLDTNRGGQVYVVGNSLYISNSKSKGYIYLTAPQGFNFEEDLSGSLLDLTTIDTNGIQVKRGNIYFTGGTQQIKIPSDTASDYDNNDIVTLNRQSGNITTKSLTTSNGSYYDLTLVNSLINSNSKIFVSVVYGGGSNTSVPCYPTHTVNYSGSATIGLLNVSGSSLNGTVKLSYVIFN